MTSLLIIFQCSPHSSGSGQEGLDAVLAAVAMELEVAIVFVDDGVFLLTKKMHPKSSELRNYTKGFAALADFGIDDVYVENTSIESRGLVLDELSIQAEALGQDDICALINRYDGVFTF